MTQRDFLGRARHSVLAVDHVSFTLSPGKTLAVVGESGAGKSTLGRLVLRLIEPDSGQIEMQGVNVRSLRWNGLRRWRRHAQMIFQNPHGSLDPRMTIGDSVGEPLRFHTDLSQQLREKAAGDLLERVGLGPEHLEKYPYECSGGQLQRVAIARALATQPELIVCDEPVTALDVSVRAQVLNLMADLQEESGLSYLFICHDLSLVRAFSHDVAVMHDGRIVETGPTLSVLREPQHPVTRQLLAAAPLHPRYERERRRALAEVSQQSSRTG